VAQPNLPYRRCVITDEISQDLDRAIALATAFGLQGLEIRSVWGQTIHELDDAQLQRLKAAAGAADLAIAAVAPPFLKGAIDEPEEWRQHRQILERTLRAAEMLDARIVRGFTFWRQGTLADAWERIVAAYREVLPTIERSGCVVAVENEGACMIGTTAPLVRLVHELASPQVRALWDPANGFHDGELAMPDAYARVMPDTVHLHLKDGRIADGKHEHAILGEGQVGIRSVLQALAADGYAGWVSLETHYRPPQHQPNYRTPGGAAFSEAGEFATWQCLTAWDQLLAEI
jgi:L-ribulose-5-phosphate 3-epimerase